MKPDAEFDAYLVCHLDEAPLPDEGFTRAVAARMQRHRRHRRLAFAGAVAVATVIAATAIDVSPAPVCSFRAITPEIIAAALLLITVCSLVWIGTESRSPARISS